MDLTIFTSVFGHVRVMLHLPPTRFGQVRLVFSSTFALGTWAMYARSKTAPKVAQIRVKYHC